MGDMKVKKFVGLLPANISKSLKFLIVFCILAIFASPLFAQLTVRLNGYGNLRLGAGGEFTFLLPEDNGWAQSPLDYYDSAALNNGGFQTFCLEYDEYLWQNTTYFAELSLSAKSGGSEHGFDNISKGSAWLYEQFATGQLESYVYEKTFERKISAYHLQKAIWLLEDEAVGIDNSFVKLVADQFGSLDDAKEDYLEIDGNVRVMTLTKLDGSIVQDQIVLAPPILHGPPVVPLPGALMLGTFGLGLLRWKNKKFLS
ncbi:MAG: hypothetical protein FVQ82_12485 [Planctomycetes bacterium]|nr:hypothetical protein [Planctomycetota bacterium]